MHKVQLIFLCAMLNEEKSTRNQPVIQNIESEMTTADIHDILLHPLAWSRALLSDRWGRHFDRKNWPIALFFNCLVTHQISKTSQSLCQPERERGWVTFKVPVNIFLAAFRAGHFYFHFSFPRHAFPSPSTF